MKRDEIIEASIFLYQEGFSYDLYVTKVTR